MPGHKFAIVLYFDKLKLFDFKSLFIIVYTVWIGWSVYYVLSISLSADLDFHNISISGSTPFAQNIFLFGLAKFKFDPYPTTIVFVRKTCLLHKLKCTRLDLCMEVNNMNPDQTAPLGAV